MFWHKPIPKPKAKPLVGVNLGGWLLLEKWMTPSLFAGTAAEDESTLMQQEHIDITERLQHHRDTFITREDFTWLQLHGVRAVRLPVGYWVFGGAEPFRSAIEYVDAAFQWAKETGIQILLDLHGAPGSQNGNQESGQIGSTSWHRNQKNILTSLEIIKKLAERYAGNPALLGIELLNEPSSKIPKRTLKKYYQAAYRIIRHTCGNDVWVVFSDSFKPRRWKRQLRAPEFVQTYIDSHQYQVYTSRDKNMDIAGHLGETLGSVARQLGNMRRYHPVVVGEWSLALDPKSVKNLNQSQILAATRAYGNAQLIAFEQTAAWFYWSYKIEEGGVWSFKDSIERGLLPNFAAY